MSEAPKPFSVMGLPVHLLDDYTNWLRSRLQKQKGTHVVTLNAEMVMQAKHDKALGEAIQQAELVVPDGSGVIFYLRLRNQQQQRCTGIGLAASLLETAGQLEASSPVCFYGGAPGMAKAAAKVWRQRVPGIAITTEHGYLSPKAEQKFRQTLAEQQPQLILVSLGVPRQELWIRENRWLCPQAIWMGVGGSFDIWAGVKPRAPLWLQKNHLEWLYRLYQEPWRWRRMLVLPQFALRALLQR